MYCRVHFGKPVYLDHMREKYERKNYAKIIKDETWKTITIQKNKNP